MSQSSGSPGPEGPGGRPERVRVTAPVTPSRGPRPSLQGQPEINGETEISAIYLRALMRAQLRLALGILLALVGAIGAFRLLFALAPGLSSHTVIGVPLAWFVLLFGFFPVTIGLAWHYVHLAERNEQNFRRSVEGH